MRIPIKLIVIGVLLFAGAARAIAAEPAESRQARVAARSDSVNVISNVPYADTDNPRQMLDLLIPTEGSSDPLPVIVFIHGGAWLGGDKSAGRRQLTDFVATGHYAAASVGYRLSQEAQWPAQIHDCKAAIRWIRANATAHGLDSNQIGVWGPSAGGHLVAVLGTSGDVAAMDGSLGAHADVSSRVTCVVDFFGPTDFLQMNKAALKGSRLDHDAPNAPEALLIGGPIQENPDKVAAANPITYVSADDPPFLIVHGTQDPLVPFNQSELLYAALKDAKVTSTLITVEGAGHGNGFGPDVDRLVARFFDHHLRGTKVEWKDQTIKASTNARR